MNANMDQDNIPNVKPDPPDPEELPQVFAVSKEANTVKFSRRDFLQIATTAAAAAVVSSCTPQAQPPTVTHSPTRTPTETPTRTPTKTSTPTLTSTPTPLPFATVKSNANVRFGPGVDTRVVGGLAAREQVLVLGRNTDGSWLRIQQEGGVDGWIKATLVDFTAMPVNDLPIVTPVPTSTPLPGRSGKTNPGQTGRDYSYTDEFGTTHTYTLPCDEPLPSGATCTCDCVTVPSCSCDDYKAPKDKRDQDQDCTCDTVCTCDTQGGHYWYPN